MFIPPRFCRIKTILWLIIGLIGCLVGCQTGNESTFIEPLTTESAQIEATAVLSTFAPPTTSHTVAFTSLPSITPTFATETAVSTPTPSVTPIFATETAVSTPTPSITPYPTIAFTPPECIQPDTPPETWQECQFQYSPYGPWMTYSWGEDYCGQALSFIDLTTGEMIPISGQGGHVIQHFEDGRMLLSLSYCEGGSIFVFHPQTRELTELGDIGKIIWNLDKTIFMVSADTYSGVNLVWAYNVLTDTYFFPKTAGEHPVWTPDYSHFVYQRRDWVWVGDKISYPPLQIFVVDVATGEQQLLVNDPQYDYHLCFRSDGENRCTFSGDWVATRRILYQPGEYEFQDFNNPEVICLFHAQGCPNPTELWGVNWRTGELLPWETVKSLSSTSTPIPTNTP